MVTKTSEPGTSTSRRRASAPSAWLREHGLRVTRSRVAMIELLRRAKNPMPLGDIHAALAGKDADPEAACDFATVFRFLKVLEDQALVDKQPWVDGTDRYELTPDASCPGAAEGAGHDHHHHFLVCRQCQRTERIEECLVSRLQTSLGKRTGYREIVHTLQFSGLCPHCQPAAAPAAARNGSLAGARSRAPRPAH